MSKLEKRLGRQTVVLESKPKIIATHSVVGKKESEGPLKDYFDDVVKDDQNGKKSLLMRFITKPTSWTWSLIQILIICMITGIFPHILH